MYFTAKVIMKKVCKTQKIMLEVRITSVCFKNIRVQHNHWLKWSSLSNCNCLFVDCISQSTLELKWSSTGCSFSETLILTSINPKYYTGFVWLFYTFLFRKSTPTQVEVDSLKTIKCRISKQSRSHLSYGHHMG